MKFFELNEEAKERVIGKYTYKYRLETLEKINNGSIMTDLYDLGLDMINFDFSVREDFQIILKCNEEYDVLKHLKDNEGGLFNAFENLIYNIETPTLVWLNSIIEKYGVSFHIVENNCIVWKTQKQVYNAEERCFLTHIAWMCEKVLRHIQEQLQFIVDMQLRYVSENIIADYVEEIEFTEEGEQIYE